MAKFVLATFRPRLHVSGYLWKWKFFSPFSKNIESFLPIHMKHPLRSMRHARSIWCMTSSYSKTSVFPWSLHTQTKSRRFQKSLLWRAFLKRSVFSDCFYRIRVDGRSKPKKKISVFKQKRIWVALSCIMLEAKAWLTVEMMITSLSCPWNSSTDPTFTSPNPKRSNSRRSFSTYELNKTTKTKNCN